MAAQRLCWVLWRAHASEERPPRQFMWRPEGKPHCTGVLLASLSTTAYSEGRCREQHVLLDTLDILTTPSF